MVARKSPDPGKARPLGELEPEERACLAETRDCRCRRAVMRAYRELIQDGREVSCALRVATRVYSYHHPEVHTVTAREVVKMWVHAPSLH